MVSNFEDRGTLVPSVIGVCTVMMALAVLATSGRVFANRKQLKWSDYICVAALVFSLSEASLMMSESQLRLARHQWDISVCWLLGDTVKILFVRSILGITGGILAKISILLLLHQTFTIERHMKLAIRGGLGAALVAFVLSVGFQIAYVSPRAGETWDDMSKKTEQGVTWSIVGSVLNLLLDLNIFLLPFPIITKLNWSTRKRLKALAVFSTAFLAVIASVVSLVYRAKMATDMSDKAWKATLVLLCIVVEVHITIIVSLMPGFSKFVRVYVARRGSASTTSSDSNTDRNKPRTKGEKDLGQGDSWLFKTNATTEATANRAPGLESEAGPGVLKTVDVEQGVSEPLAAKAVVGRGISGYDIYQEPRAEKT